MTLDVLAAERHDDARSKPCPQLARRMRVQGAPLDASRWCAEPASPCRLAVGVLQASGAITSALVITLESDHAEILAPRLAVEVGDVVWLVLELGTGRPYTVVLTCSVSDVESERIGLCFTGLPEDEVDDHCKLGGLSGVCDHEAVAV